MKNKSLQKMQAKKVHANNSTTAQRTRLYEALQDSPDGLTTDEIRRDLDIMQPAARIYELRWEQNLNIQTVHTTIPGKGGTKHHGVARYVLLSGKWIEDDAA